MDRDTFSNSRRARHFGRSTQNFQNLSNQQSFGKLDNSFRNRNLRDIYLNETHGSATGNNEFGKDAFNHFFGSSIPFFNSLPAYTSQPPLTPPFQHDEPSPVPSDLTFHLASLGFDDHSSGHSTSSSSRKMSMSCQLEPKYMRINRMSSLPTWALDENREIRCDLTLKKVVDEGLVLMFSMDKSGCHFLQSNYYGENTQQVDPQIREKISREVLGNREVFLTICKNIFGNFFLQRVIEYSNPVEQEIIKRYIISDITALCLDKSACRVVQTALEKLEPRYTDAIVGAIPRKNRLMAICTDQNANHVIQKVIKKMPLSKWEFLITYLCKNDHDNMLDICQDKYGCRVVQTIVEVLSVEHIVKTDEEDRSRALRRLMNKILSKCQKLASNEFANYVIQHIIETPGVLSSYRDAIIESCLLRNLLSMSQEKYASHVVERAFCFAPPAHVAEMMEEIFDGYVPHPDTGKDALDILIFHQFGNYVVQRMLQICVNAVLGKRETIINGVNCRDKFEGWLSKLYLRARKERARLTSYRFSSGKKILEILESMESQYNFTPITTYDRAPFSPALFSPANTTSIDWPTRTNSFSSADHHVDYEYNFQNFTKF